MVKIARIYSEFHKTYISIEAIAAIMQIYIVLLSVLAIIVSASMPVLAGAGIVAEQVDGNVYQFKVEGSYNEPLRWSFGDGATSTMDEPVHEFQGGGVYQVRAEDENGISWGYELDLTPNYIDEQNQTVNVATMSVPGSLLLVSCSAMFLLAKTGNHLVADFLGRNGRGLLMLAYFCGAVVGFTLVIGPYIGTVA